ncbi:four-carbon acid sugar kinase family protein [Rubellimicrobium rubrum]|uniref:Four-carbon acid sugar kinase family protein n=1 Tax=Rubellimicrobium rubrum TaxID=2585369 RepID=A0A5C4MW43_9RHOB|nr:four-carbon acid sugar kinase family protein [Rubellimicrobium rubrum]
MLAILADDLTGALDSAAPFAGRGMRVMVALSPAATAAACAQGCPVVAISTQSRELSPVDAQSAVARAVATLPPGTRLFKKIDSRLKGHIEAELSALDVTRALVIPAIVDFGRVVKDGAVTGFGVTEAIPIAPLLGRFAERSRIPDVVSHEAMRAELDKADTGDLLVGARGLAEALSRRMTGREEATAPPLAGPSGLMVVGSRDPITLSQVDALRSLDGVLHVPAPNGTFDPQQALGSAADIIVVQAVPGDRPLAPHVVAANLAKHLAPLVPGRCDTLVVTGGATAEAVLGVIAIDSLELLGECLPGLAVGRALGLTIVAKSGGFGEAGVLARVAGMIRGTRE